MLMSLNEILSSKDIFATVWDILYTVALLANQGFRQKLFSEDGHEILDDEVLGCAPLKLQVLVLEFWPPDAENSQIMVTACAVNDSLALEKLLQRPVTPNLTDAEGRTPLYHAALNGNTKPMQLMLEAKADKDAGEIGVGTTPLHAAVFGGHLEAVRLLLETGASKDKLAFTDGATPLHLAAEAGNLDVVRLLIEVGANKDQPTTLHGATPLHLAAEAGHADVVQLLVEAGANKDHPNTANGATPTTPTTEGAG